MGAGDSLDSTFQRGNQADWPTKGSRGVDKLHVSEPGVGTLHLSAEQHHHVLDNAVYGIGTVFKFFATCTELRRM